MNASVENFINQGSIAASIYKLADKNSQMTLVVNYFAINLPKELPTCS